MARSDKAVADGAFSGTEPAMRTESTYITLLGQAASCKRADDTLTYDKGGNALLILAPLHD